MRRAILHIGFNKTGTSSIQNFLDRNRDRLLDAGICYPRTASDGAAHHALAEALKARDGPRLARFGEGVAAETGHGEDLLISSEALAAVPEPELLRAVLRGFEVTVVAYVREHASHLASWYQQDIQMSDMACGFRSYALLNQRVFSHRLGRWRAAFGRERMRVRLYDRAALPGGDVLADLMGLVGVEGWRDWPRAGYENNLSVTGNLLFFKRVCNVFAGRAACGVTEEIEALSGLSPRFRGSLAIPQDEVAEVVARNAPDRDALEADFGVVLPERRGALPGRDMPERETLAEDWALVSEAARERGMAVSRLLGGFRIEGG